MIEAWNGIGTVVVGMLHAPPLPGSPGYDGDWDKLEARILADVEALASGGSSGSTSGSGGGGVDGLMLENFGDTPFFKDRVAPITVAAMTRLALAVRRVADLPLGINMLRNDACSALSVAAAVGADYIRVNILSGAMVTDQGVIEGRAAELLRLRQSLKAERVRILADVAVKHAAGLVDRPLSEQAEELVHRAGADGLIVSGVSTGAPTSLDDLQAVKAAAGEAPVWVGSGVNDQSVHELSAVADGLIVGSSLKRDGVLSAPIDAARVRKLMTKK